MTGWRDDDCKQTYDGMHGAADIHGRCPYCRRKYEPASPKPDRVPLSNLTTAYAYFYDPDWGNGLVGEL